MALSENRIVYGIHSIAPYSRTDGLPYGILKVLGGGTISLSAEFEDLFGGSSLYQWASEIKTITSEVTATVKSMPDFLFERFLGATVSTTAAGVGAVTTLTNVFGTSLVDASTGVASISVKSGSEADLKANVYVVKVVSATTVDVYALSDVDALVGTDQVFQDDLLKITASPLTIVASTAVEIPGTGLELTGGSGTIGMTTGHTAKASSTKAHGGVSEITIGASGSTFEEVGMLGLAKKRANGDIFELDLLKVLPGGFPIPLEEGTFAIPEMTMKLLLDETVDSVFKIRAIKSA